MINQFKAWIMSTLNLIAGAALTYMATRLGQNSEPTAPVVEMINKPQGEETKGVSNRNPGNLTVLSGGQKWKGQIGTDVTGDQYGHVYAVFSDHHWGLRACAKLLRNYQNNHGLKTVGEMINRYAPSEGGNPTNSYATFVEGQMLLRPGEQINLNDDGTLVELVRAVVRFENGYHPYSAQTIMSAVNAV